MRAIGFKRLLHLQKNPTMSEVIQWTNDVVEECEKRDAGSEKKRPLLLFLMGHGCTSGIYDSKMKVFNEELLISALNTPSMNDRLKIMTLVSCRGFRQPRSILCDDCPSSQQPIQNLVIFYSALKGFLSKRRSEEGVPFIEELCKELRNKYHKWSIVKIFHFVKSRLKKFQINKIRYNLTPDMKLYNVSLKYQKIAMAFL